MGSQYKFVPDSHIEIIRPQIRLGAIRHALFDFDGTVSLIREGWQGIVIPMMVEILMQTPEHEARPEIEKIVKEFVTRLTGKQTIYQMIQLCEEITARGGIPKEPAYYKLLYNERLDQHIKDRIAGLKSGGLEPEDATVAGTFAWLEILTSRGVVCYVSTITSAITEVHSPGVTCS